MLLLLACTQPDSAANKAPDAPIVAITPTTPTTLDDLVLSVQGGGADPDGDDVSLDIAWFRDGADAGVTGETVSADLTTRGEAWKVVVTPTDGDLEGTPGVAEVSIADSAPSLTLSLDPLNPTAADEVVVSAAAEDVDGDAVEVAWSWTRDGASAGLTEPTLPAGTHTRGETWEVTATPSDGTLDGEPAVLSFTVGNALPTLTSVSLAPADATVLDTIEATFGGGDDADGDELTLAVEWWVDGVVVATDEVPYGSTAALSGLFAKGQEVQAVARPDDGYDLGEPVESATLVVADSAPSATGASISPSPLTAADDATCLGSGWSDPDGDPEGWAVTWTVNGVAVSTDTVLAAGSFSRDDVVGCTLVPDDGELTGEAVSAVTTVTNAAPRCTSAAITIGPEPATIATTLSVTVDGYTGCADADGDALTTVYAWTVNGAPAGGGSTLSGLDRGDSVVLTTTLSDGWTTGASATSNMVVVVNQAPAVSVTISPGDPTAADTLSAVTTTSDLEGDTIDLSYAWTRDGTSAGSSATLSGVKKGELVAVTVTADDGSDTSSASASVTILNAAPSAPALDLSPDIVEDADDVVCVVTEDAIDADGDPLSYTFSWTVDGVAYTSATATTFPGDTVPGAATTLGETWVCSVVVSDGESTGPTASVSTVIGCDRDGDGYADEACGGDDCDDGDPMVSPGAAELCDGASLDEDCDGLVNDADPDASGRLTFYADSDRDGYGDAASTTTACTQPGGYAATADDCDDGDKNVHPDATERCDGADTDEDCDGLADDADSPVSGQVLHYTDADGDGYGDEGATGSYHCTGVAGLASNKTDCDDTNPDISPGDAEVCNDGIDNDCSSSTSCGIDGALSASDADYVLTNTAISDAPYMFASGDWNGDGDRDFAFATGNTTNLVAVFYGPFGAGDTQETDSASNYDVLFSGSYLGYTMSGVGDVNGDGYDELYAQAGMDGESYLLYGAASWSDRAVGSTDLLFDVATFTPAVPAGDFNADGYDDFFVPTQDSGSSWWAELWVGSASGPALETSWGPNDYVIGSNGVGGHDWDGDGIDDFLAGHSVHVSPSIDIGGVILLGDSSPVGTAVSTTDRWFTGLASGGVYYAGDVNGDGYPDAYYGDYTASKGYIYTGPPTTGLDLGDAYATTDGKVASAGDLDNDGAEELMVTMPNTKVFDTPISSGALSTADATITLTGSPNFVGWGADRDYSGDGVDDLILAYNQVGNDYIRIFEGGGL